MRNKQADPGGSNQQKKLTDVLNQHCLYEQPGGEGSPILTLEHFYQGEGSGV